MDPQRTDESSSHELAQSLPDVGLPGILETQVSGDWLAGDPTVDPNALGDFYFCSSEPVQLAWPQWLGLESQTPSPYQEQHHSALASPETESRPLPDIEIGDSANTTPLSNLANVSQWLDGAYRPPVLCTHCRKHRLQCLIIRTTSANPNPVTSCSSCVALFRECSLSKGEKRLPSRFETFSPVLGHLHGLPEQMENPVGHPPEMCSARD